MLLYQRFIFSVSFVPSWCTLCLIPFLRSEGLVVVYCAVDLVPSSCSLTSAFFEYFTIGNGCRFSSKKNAAKGGKSGRTYLITISYRRPNGGTPVKPGKTPVEPYPDLGRTYFITTSYKLPARCSPVEVVANCRLPFPDSTGEMAAFHFRPRTVQEWHYISK